MVEFRDVEVYFLDLKVVNARMILKKPSKSMRNREVMKRGG